MSNASRIVLVYGDAPGTPASGKVELYSKADKYIYYKGDDGIERVVTASGTFVSTTLLELTDTPAAYDAGKYLYSTASGTIWESASGDHDQLNNLDYASAGHTGFQPTGDYAANTDLTTVSGLVDINTTDIATNVENIAANTASIAVVSGTADTNAIDIAANTTLIGTTSGTLQGEIDANTTHSTGDGSDHSIVVSNQTHAIGDGSDHTDVAQNTSNLSTLQSDFTSHSGTANIHFTEASVDHDNITNTHNLTTDIDHDALTNYDVNKHRLINDSADGATDLWSAEKIIDGLDDITSLSGVLDDHNHFDNLDGGAPNEYFHLTENEHTALVSGTECTIHIHDDRYYTETEVDTISGSLNTDIAANTSAISDNTALIATTSGTLQSQITDNTTHSTGDGSDHVDVSQNTSDIADNTTLITTTSGVIVAQIITNHSELNELDYASAGHTGFASEEALLTASGVLDDKIKATENAAATTYYMHEDISDLGGFEQMRSTPAEDAESKDSVTINSGDGETAMDKYVTVSGEPNTTSIHPGTWVWVLWADVSATSQGPHYLRAKWYRREQGGTEHYLFTQEQEITSTDPTRYLVETSTSGIDMAVTDRLVVKAYAQIGGGSNRTIGYYIEGVNRPSRFNTPVLTSLITDHGELTGLGDDDHPQYHNDVRGDARYYTETELDAGQLDNRYYTEAEVITISGGLQTQIDGKDNYASWSFAVDGVTKDAITSGDVLDFIGGDNITVTRSADDQITISGSAGGGGLSNVVEDTTPQLGGDLDANTHAIVAADHGAAATDQVVNVSYGTGAAPAANTTTIGSLYIKYTA